MAESDAGDSCGRALERGNREHLLACGGAPEAARACTPGAGPERWAGSAGAWPSGFPPRGRSCTGASELGQLRAPVARRLFL